MRAMSRALATLLVVPALALAACGGGSSDVSQIKDLIKKVADDSSQACTHLTKHELSQLGGSKDACVSGLKDSPRGYIKGPISVDVSGDNATADFTAENGKRHVSFVKQDGKWLIDDIKGG
jgi:hypothetical protein